MPRLVDPLIKELRRIRASRGISQAQIAEKIGTNRETVCGWENGASSPSLHWLRRWVQALGLTITLSAIPEVEAPTRAVA